MTKYVRVQNTVVKTYCGATVPRVADKIRFGELSVSGYDRIFIQLGTNDIANLIGTGEISHVTVHEITRRFRSLRDVIRKRNSRALVIFSSILPRLERYELFKPYVRGVNFPLEKWCAKSQGTTVFNPTYTAFLDRSKPRAELYSVSDGLHLNGAGVDRFEAAISQALSTGYLLERVRSRRARTLSTISYWSNYGGCKFGVWPCGDLAALRNMQQFCNCN